MGIITPTVWSCSQDGDHVCEHPEQCLPYQYPQDIGCCYPYCCFYVSWENVREGNGAMIFRHLKRWY